MIERISDARGASAHHTATDAPAAKHGNRSDHLANERTHLAYLRTAISLISLGITVNRFSTYLQQHDELPAHRSRLDVLPGTASAGLGMVIFGLGLMLVGLHRYVAMDDAIEKGIEHRDRPLVVTLTLSAIAGGIVGILWMFPR
jgi:putative membrane protein